MDESHQPSKFRRVWDAPAATMLRRVAPLAERFPHRALATPAHQANEAWAREQVKRLPPLPSGDQLGDNNALPAKKARKGDTCHRRSDASMRAAVEALMRTAQGSDCE